jgi:squalene cyclase
MRTTRRIVSLLAAAGLSAAAAAPLAAQGDRQPPAVNQPAIDEAIKKGAEWLLEQAKGGSFPTFGDEWQTTEELGLYALLHAGVDPKNPEVVKLIKLVAERVPKHTYTSAIRAQAMHKYDTRMLTDHVRGATQWLIDNQGQRGFWGYGKEVHIPDPPKITVTPDTRKVYTGPKGGAVVDGTPGARNTTATARTVLKRGGWGEEHDNSNTQYALLGLAACMAAGYYPPQDCLDLAEKWLTDCQNDDGGWCYKERGEGSTGAMTAGGVSSLCIVLRAKNNLNPGKDLRVQKALKWLGDNLTFDGNPHGGWHYYWIYSVERAGSMAGTDWFGDRPWFKEGSEWLVGKQNGDGSWGNENGGKKIADTAWAILFLRRATRSIVYSGPSKK